MKNYPYSFLAGQRIKLDQSFLKKIIKFHQSENLKKKYFNRFFRKTSFKPSEELWQNYLDWEETFKFQNFSKYCAKQEKIAETEINAFPNPLKNGKQGEAYSCSFTLPSTIRRCEFIGLEDIGLTLVQDGQQPIVCTLSGIPLKAGDLKITMRYEHNRWVKGMPRLSRDFTLTILPDPKTLWKNIPTDPQIAFYKPDQDSYLLPGDSSKHEKNLIAASLRGRSHAHKGAPRDDHFLVKFEPNSGWYIMSVADGAGSATFSRAGSQIACETAVASCLHHIAQIPSFDEIVQQAVQDRENISLKKQAISTAYRILPQAALEAANAIRQESASNGHDVREYATTLLLALCKRFNNGWALMSFGIGDGAMAAISQKEEQLELNLLGKPDEGEFSGQTYFITMKSIFSNSTDLIERIRFYVLDDFDAVILMTDGVSDAKFETGLNLQDPARWKALAGELKPVLQEYSKEALLNWLSFWSPGNHDDRTIAILY